MENTEITQVAVSYTLQYNMHVEFCSCRKTWMKDYGLVLLEGLLVSILSLCILLSIVHCVMVETGIIHLHKA